jgi:protein tyrosine phosphatase (PTP) superfamily phosphohydrolase (DUF442 family)
MRQSLLVGTLLLALTGCNMAPTAIAGHPAGAMAEAAIGASALSARNLSTFGSKEDLAAAAAAETSETWTPPSELSPFNDPADDTNALSEFPGIKIVRFAKIDDQLYRGGLPSKTDLQSLKALGIKTDIDLMGEVPVFDTFLVAREKRWAKEVGIKFVNVQVPTGHVPLKKKISDATATAFLKVALDPANQPVYVHCVHGRDRTGTMVAVYRMVKHKYSNEQAFAEMRSFGFTPEDYPSLAAFVKSYKPAVATPALASGF